ncbi:PREDICTED: transient receptor potential channel pyrexia [Nicrophorus vespilloides]|uniref:Transient receptor potential channel pyrexia n=1 Tax=Nicrophorus vespilloides TaxID=110193 RepID=A0ABM1M1U4_NICVS|nr:PREDICTED: transient receptor potential channel pyrexia [Nicrophorus vespilloides]
MKMQKQRAAAAAAAPTAGADTENKMKWMDDEEEEEARQDWESISSESENCGSDCEMRMTSKQPREISDADRIRQQLLSGNEDLQRMVRQENIAAILGHPNGPTTGLLIAAHLGKPKVLKDLLTISRDNISITDASGWGLLHLAASGGNVECVKMLLEVGLNVDQWDRAQRVTPLHCAASGGNVQCLKYLVKCGADIDVGIERRSALRCAVESSEVLCVKELLELGANPNTLQVYSETPLHVAASLGSSAIIKLLIKHGAGINVQCGQDRSTALHLAAEDGNVESVRMLLEAGANVGALNNKKQTPLHIASLCQAPECLELLLRSGAHPNQRDVNGRTALHCSIVKMSRSCECVKHLIGAGVNVNEPDAFGYTALHLAALNEYTNCILLLINNGGDVTARTNGGISVLTFITRRTPEVIPRYFGKFDQAIKLTEHEIGDVDCELKLDFTILVPTTVHGETGLLLNFIEVGHREILKHPLCETFLFLKWRRIRKFFLISLFYHALYVSLYSAYTMGVFLKDCKPMRSTFSNSCLMESWCIAVGYTLLALNVLILLKEIFQFAHSWHTYIIQWENWLQWLTTISVFCCVSPIDGNIKMMYSVQHHVAAVGIFLAWLELMMIVGRFPIFGLYIQMFTTVAVNFTKFLLAYLCLLVAFGLSFGVLFAGYPSFKNVFVGLLKIIIMMSGELEFEDMFDESDKPIAYPVTTHIMFLAFVILVTVILTNLMVGLAVSDIQGLQQSAGLDRLVRQAELVAHLESMLFSRLLKWVPRSFLTLLYKQALLLKSHRDSALYIRPNDPREAKIPQDLINSIYNLVVERKVRKQKKRDLYLREDSTKKNSMNYMSDYKEC